MKVQICLMMGFLCSLWSNAQELECKENLSIYDGYVKTKRYGEAYEPWKKVYDSCPDIHWANFSYGERILEYKIEEANTEAKSRYINDLIELYNNSINYFPEKKSQTEVMVDIVLLKYKHKLIITKEIYAQLDQAFKKGAKHFKDPKALFLYFSSAVDLYEAKHTRIEVVFEVYDKVTERITEENTTLTAAIGKLLMKEEQGNLNTKESRKLKSYTSYSSYYGKILNSIEVKLGNLAACENLIPFYENRFEERKEDIVWIKKAVGRLFAKDCLEAPIFQKLFDAQLQLDPSADAFLYSGILKQRKGDDPGAIADFNKAMELETNALKKSNIAYKIASAYEKKNKPKARNFAQKAIEANPAHGNAFLLIARLYANSANICGDNAFDKRALYWKAADLARRAAKVDPSLSIRASKAIESYEGRAPTKEMIFTRNMAGKTVYFKCWVGGSIVVPKLE
ncbi:tetratricopeptide repeat protein [Spongiimicrobium salis]|uniref:tetratricopeptide repeat protein n=1 Tax=Spongiimicrobium salis TaxID=1667022 RepID=UPI00374D26EB